MKAILGISTTILLYSPGYVWQTKVNYKFWRINFKKSRGKTTWMGQKINFGKGFIMSAPPE